MVTLTPKIVDLRARKALKLWRADKSPVEIARLFGMATPEIHHLLRLGKWHEKHGAAQLRDGERLLLQTLLEIDAPNRSTLSREAELCADRARGWAARTSKRLTGWGWISLAGNGYIGLTEPGRAAAYLMTGYQPLGSGE